MENDWESDPDAAFAVATDMECMRIQSLIDELSESRSSDTSYGKGQRYILRELKRRILESA
jgi:hypothetical protein